MEGKNLKDLDNQIKLFHELEREGIAWQLTQNLRCMIGIQDAFSSFDKKMDDEFIKEILPIIQYAWGKSDSEDIYNIAEWCTKQVLSNNLTMKELEEMDVQDLLDKVWDEYHYY